MKKKTAAQRAKINAKRDYQKEYKRDHSSKKAKDLRAARNTANRALKKAGKLKKGDGKEGDHKTPLSKGGSKSLSNVRVRSRSANRAAGAKLVPKSSAAKGGRRSKRGRA